MNKSHLKEYSSDALDTLLGSGEEENEASFSSPTSIPIDAIVLNASQPRRYFDVGKLESLARDISANGLLSPVVVRQQPDGNYELIAGERRLRACRIAGLVEIPVNIIDCDDKTATLIRLTENLQREDLNAYEETMGILQLLGSELDCGIDVVVSLLYDMDYKEYTCKKSTTHNVVGSDDANRIVDTFSRLGRLTWQSFVAHRLPLLKLPADIKVVLERGELEYTKALAISRVKDAPSRATLLKKALAEKLSVSAIKEVVTDLLSANTQEPKVTLQREFTANLGKVLQLAKKDKSILRDRKKLNKANKLIGQLMELFQGESVEETINDNAE